MRRDEPESSSSIQTSSTVTGIKGIPPRARILQYGNAHGTAELRDDQDSAAARRPLEEQEPIYETVVNGDWENKCADNDVPELNELHAQPDLAPHALAVTQQRSEDLSQPNVSGRVRNDAVSWRDLPNKKQLAILTLARLSEPLSQSSLQAYMFYQLKPFDPTLPASSISFQAGVLQASFTGAQLPIRNGVVGREYCWWVLWGLVSPA